MRTNTNCFGRIKLVFAIFIAGTAGSAAYAGGPSAGELRVSESAYWAQGGREREAPDATTTDVHEAQTADSERRGAELASERQKLASVSSLAPNTDFWFYTADVRLFADHDGDGYYYGIDLLFDADTYYSAADVYAIVYLSRDGGAWTEYATTETFSIFGASADDEYVIVTELLAGYPSGSYDILIELFDAWDDSFVADIGPEITSELGYLPLEDAERDAPAPITIISRGGGGAAGAVSLLVLGLIAGVSACVRRRQLRRIACHSRNR